MQWQNIIPLNWYDAQGCAVQTQEGSKSVETFIGDLLDSA
jgi:hypothetical protein